MSIDTAQYPFNYDAWTLEDDTRRIDSEVRSFEIARDYDEMPPTPNLLDRLIGIASYRVHDMRGTV